MPSALSFPAQTRRRCLDGCYAPQEVPLVYATKSLGRGLSCNWSGVALCTRAMSKVRLQEHGADSAERRLVRLGAPPRPFGQDPREWLKDVLAGNTFTRVRHPGNHLYAFALGSPQQKAILAQAFAPAKPFPKTLDSVQGDLAFLTAGA